MKRPFLTIGCALIGIGLVVAKTEAQAQPKEQPKPYAKLLRLTPVKIDPKDSKLKKLQKQRFNEAIGGMRKAFARFEKGFGLLSEMHKLTRRVLVAGLDLYDDDPKKKMELLKQNLDWLKFLEKVQEREVRKGKAAPSSLHDFRYRRLSGEITLEKLKRKLAKDKAK